MSTPEKKPSVIFDRETAEKLEAQLRDLQAAENKLRDAKTLLDRADVFNWLVVETEKLQLRVHFEVKRAQQKLAEVKR